MSSSMHSIHLQFPIDLGLLEYARLLACLLCSYLIYIPQLLIRLGSSRDYPRGAELLK